MPKNKKSKKKAKKVTQEGKFDHPLYGAGFGYEFDLPVFRAPRGPIEYPEPSFQSMRGGDHMQISVSRLANVAALLAFGAAAFGNVVLGLSGLELVAAGLGLHAGGDLLEDILS